MKIKEMTDLSRRPFSALKDGDVFVDGDGDICIAMETVGEAVVIAGKASGTVLSFGENEQVRLLPSGTTLVVGEE